MKRLKTAGDGPPGGSRGGGQLETSARRIQRRRWAIAAFALLTTVAPAGLAAAVTAEEFDITIPIETVVFAPEGSTTVLATELVATEFLGQICTVAARSENQDSIHVGNDLIVESGGSMVVVENVEGGVGSVVNAEGDIELGSEIVVSLLMGPDAVFSAGIVVHVDCTAVLATSTTTTEATTPTTTTEATTSTSAAVGATTSTVEDEVLGTVITSSTLGDQVGDLEELPFTGSHDGAWLFVAGSLLALGGILVIGAWRRDED
jgi:hypothetical protein